MTLHSYYECPGPCMRQVLDSPFGYPTYFSALDISLTHLGLSMQRSGFSSLLPAVTITGGIRPSIF